MSDLAMMSSGEDAEEIKRISSIMNAIIGFAPFLFDLQLNADLNSVLEAIAMVANIQDSTKLLSNWASTTVID